MPIAEEDDDRAYRIVCTYCKKRKYFDDFYDHEGRGSKATCKDCIRSKNNEYYSQHRLESCLAQQLRRFTKKIGIVEARELLRVYGSRSAVSGMTENLTVRVWDLSIKAHGSNFILLTRREALRHTEIGGKSGYPELFRRHVDDILSDILLSVPYDAEETLHDESDSEPSSFMDEDEDFLDYFELNIESLSVPPPKTPLDRGLPPC